MKIRFFLFLLVFSYQANAQTEEIFGTEALNRFNDTLLKIRECENPAFSMKTFVYQSDFIGIPFPGKPEEYFLTHSLQKAISNNDGKRILKKFLLSLKGYSYLRGQSSYIGISFQKHESGQLIETWFDIQCDKVNYEIRIYSEIYFSNIREENVILASVNEKNKKFYFFVDFSTVDSLIDLVDNIFSRQEIIDHYNEKSLRF